VRPIALSGKRGKQPAPNPSPLPLPLPLPKRASLLALATLLAGCSCDEDPDLEADGYVRCHVAAPPEGEHRAGDLTLRYDERSLTVEGLPEPFELAVAAGPLGDAVPDAEVLLILGEVTEAPDTDALVLLLAGGADRWETWRGLVSDSRPRIVDATRLRSVRLGRIELVPVGGAPPRYARTDGSCGISSDGAEGWELEAPRDGVTRVLVSWAAADGLGLYGERVEARAVAAVAERASTADAIFAWPREDPRSVLPASGPWVTRADGARAAPGWTVYEARADGLVRRPPSP